MKSTKAETRKRTKEKFFIATEDEIRSGRVTDVYFNRTQQILEAKGIDKQVKMEIWLKSFPDQDQTWGVLAGLEEGVRLLEGQPLDLWTLPEGTLFRAREPVMMITSCYRDFSVLETALLGFLCQASGIATKAARFKIAAHGRAIYSFGVRRLHPAIAPMIDRNAFIGGCDGVSSVLGAELLGEPPVGTIPHALVLILGDSSSTTAIFDEVIDKQIKRVALVDTFGDEKFEALENAKLLGDRLYAVRLDTPSSRRGSMLAIAQEVRWELDTRGYDHVKIFVSGGLNEYNIPELNSVADAYGVGTSISNARVMDFSLDIVEIEGEPIAKRGKPSGAKQLYICEGCGHRKVVLWDEVPDTCPECDGPVTPALVKFLENGKLIRDLPSAQEIRRLVLDHLPETL
ncbi:MAG: nicotinate phosphoribosyltransferase [Candidatus Bipolaricaulia bacterium]